LLGNLLWMWPVGFTLGGLAKMVSRKDPLIFRVYAAWIDSRPKAADFGGASKRKWGGISMSPLRPMRGYEQEELGRNV
jgi:Type IV secretory pathway, VirB3-like protein